MKVLLKLFSLKLVTSFLGLLYSILQVRTFGASRTIEVYFAAQSIVYLITSLTQSGQLSEFFLPEYHKLNKIKPKLGFTGLNIVLNRMFIWAIILSVVVFILTPLIIDLTVPGFEDSDKDKAVLISRVLLPYIFFQVLSSFFNTVLNAEEKFGRAESLGLVNTVLNIVVLLLLYSKLGVWALVVSLLVGKIIELFFYLFQLRKIGYRYSFIFSIDEFDHVSFFKTMKSTFLYVGATQVYSIVLTASISFLPEGIFAIFKYVQNLGNKVRGVFIQPFLTIFFTNISTLIQNSKSVLVEFQKNFKSIINVNTIILAGGILLGDDIIDLIWGGGKFNPDDVKIAYLFLIYVLIGILFSSIGGIYRKISVSLGYGKKLYNNWVISQLLTAGLTYILIREFQIYGLCLIIPLNVFLMSGASYLVYRKVGERLPVGILNKELLINIIIIGVACYLKYFNNEIITFGSNITSLLITLVSIFILSLYPLISTYKHFRS